MNGKLSVIICFLLLLFIGLKTNAQYNLIVAKDGSGDYTTVQAAINAAPTGQTTPYKIFIKKGTYKEKINIPSTKPFIHLYGEDVATVVLTYDDYASKLVTCNTNLGTQNSASFTVNATDFAASNITFENSFGDGSQAVTVLVNADRAIFNNCRFLGNQDTIYLKGGGTPRNYFKKCYIDGNVDFIFGSAVAIFDSCVVYAKSRTTAGTSYITAPNTPVGQSYGFIFRDTKFPKNTGNTLYYLSRPWASSSVATTRQKTVLLSCILSSHINPAGWSIWDANTVTSNLYYGEYNSRYFNLQPVDVSQRVAWSYQLTQTDSATYTFSNVLGTWDPCAVLSNICNPQSTNIAVANFKGTKGVASSQFSWNISWPINGINYTLYRSSDNINFAPLYNYTELTDSSVNFSYTDLSVPAAGSKYYYYLAASKDGYSSHITDTIVISNAANIVVNASAALSLCGFGQTLGTPSPSQTYTITGTNLTDNIIITPPVNFEISLDNVNWYTNSNPLQIVPTSGSVTTTIYIHLNAPVTGSSAGNIINANTGNANISVPVSGVTYPVSTSFLLQHWPLTANNTDSAAVRSSAVVASTSLVNTTTNKLYTSDGTQPPAAPIPAYSGQYGQALGANTSGNSWTNVGGTLNRGYYEQFTVTAASGSSVRIDSITFLSDFYQTVSNIKMAVAYSKNGFSSPADSSEINGGVGPTGTLLSFATSGTFSKSFSLLRNDAGPINNYALSLNGATGVTIDSGKTLTIRLYWACGSGSVPRFAYLKDVKIMGVVLNPLPFKLISFSAAKVQDKVKLVWETTQEVNVKQFEIERSTNGLDFIKIGILEAQNNTHYNQYDYYDNQFNTTVYYRIKMLDNDGRFTYSKILNIKSIKNIELQISPNPVTDNISISHAPAKGNSAINIYNSIGQMVQTIKVPIHQTASNIDVSLLAKGIYSIIYTDYKIIQKLQFIKQ